MNRRTDLDQNNLWIFFLSKRVTHWLLIWGLTYSRVTSLHTGLVNAVLTFARGQPGDFLGEPGAMILQTLVYAVVTFLLGVIVRQVYRYRQWMTLTSKVALLDSWHPIWGHLHVVCTLPFLT